VDMYRQPENLIKACNAILDRRIARAIPADKTARDYPQRIAMPLWRGDPTFMSEAQFEKFYWPGLKKSLQTHIDLGYVPVPFFEAPFGERLKCVLELPKGKIIVSIDSRDISVAKKLLSGHSCLLLRTPNSAKVWSPNQLQSFLKDIIDTWGKKPGLMIVIMVPDCATVKDMQDILTWFRGYSRY
jgi:hypothetical protein